MKFYTIRYRARLPLDVEYPCMVLAKDNWDDYGYETLYYLYYYDQRGNRVLTEGVRILRKGETSTSLPAVFDSLSDDCCSLGMQLSYYVSLATLGKERFQEVLSALNDVAYDATIEAIFRDVDGFELSLLREGVQALRGAKSLVVWIDAIAPYLPRFLNRPPSTQEVVDQIKALEEHRFTMRRYEYYRDPEYGDLEELPNKVKQNMREAQQGVQHGKEILRQWGVLITNEQEDEPILTTPETSSPDVRGEPSVNAQGILKIFLCHSSDDKPKVRELYKALKQAGHAPWLDEEEIDPGEIWENVIALAVRSSDLIIICLSSSAVAKEGYVQKEIGFALDIAQEKLENSIFIIPLKLEECDIPQRLRQYQAANYFDERGHERLMRSLRKRAEQLSTKR